MKRVFVLSFLSLNNSSKHVLINTFFSFVNAFFSYPQICNIRPRLVGNIMVDHADIVGASPVGIAPTTYTSILNLTPGLNGLGKDNYKTRRETFKFGIRCAYIRGLAVLCFSMCELYIPFTLFVVFILSYGHLFRPLTTHCLILYVNVRPPNYFTMSIIHTTLYREKLWAYFMNATYVWFLGSYLMTFSENVILSFYP